MSVQQQNTDAELDVCAAARDGRLAQHLQQYPDQARGALYTIINDLVYQRLTRGVERQRGHIRCAVSVDHLEPECHDRHQDDVAAVLDDLLRHADRRIENLPGWLVTRLRPATVDAHRRRRGERGAAQRPRLPLPNWLDDRIGGDPWLRQLAVEILVWVGVPVAMPQGIWPLSAWAERRAAVTGDVSGSGESAVANDVERVLAAMRTNPPWYERYVELPLGRKHAPLVMPVQVDDDLDADLPALQLVARDEVDDARLLDLAEEAIRSIEERVSRGDDVRTAVRDVLLVVFGSNADTEAMTQAPGAGVDARERLAKLLADPDTVDRIMATFLEIKASS